MSELPQTTATEDDEIPRRGIWEEPEEKDIIKQDTAFVNDDSYKA